MRDLDHRRLAGSDKLAADYVEKEPTGWSSVPQEESTAYNPGEHLELTRSNQSSASENEDKLPLVQCLKLYPKIVAYCMAMTIPIIGWGYDLVIVGAVTGVESFLKDYGTNIKGAQAIPGNWLTLWMALSPAGSALGAVICGWLQDRIGRKYSLMLGSLISATAISCNLFFALVRGPEYEARRHHCRFDAARLICWHY